ncbi:MAG: branched-chain amino acid ABC transporter permease [Candidatus Lambdaproteobacteria bacterium]|nr:branched-chain amino acid ABC transporter permease [Candidatus Lambdaproteobacteria bacterium]
MMPKARVKAAAWAALAVAVLAAPALGSPVLNDWNVRICSLMMVALSWNLTLNAGLISLGHSAFWGLGSYAALLAANRLGAPLPLSLLIAALAGSLAGMGLAALTGNLRGIFFAISTLAFSEILRVVGLMTPDLTGGAEGLYLTPGLRPAPAVVTFAVALGAVAAVVVCAGLALTRFNLACRAMRNNEDVSKMFGINPLVCRVQCLAVAGGMASLAGGLNLWHGGFLDPLVAFDLHVTVLSQIAPLLGGIHTLVGPVVGSVLTVFLSEGTRIGLGASGYSQLVLGVLLVVCVLAMPSGVVGLWRRVLARRARP